MTNYEKIKAMNAGEMADFILNHNSDYCYESSFEDCIYGYRKAAACETCVKEWLESEVEKNA